MIKIKHTKYYSHKMRFNKVEYNAAAGVYCMAHDFNVHFCMPEFFISKIINHSLYVDNDKGESGIGYDIIISRDLMVQLVLTAEFKRQVLQWDGATVHMKEPTGLLEQSNLNNSEMCEAVMQTAEPASTREANEIMVKILDRTYAKAELKQVADYTTHMNAEEITQLPSILEDFQDLSGGTLGNWSAETSDLEIKPGYKPFNSRYYPVPRINKGEFHKELKRLVEIGVLTPVQQSQ